MLRDGSKRRLLEEATWDLDAQQTWPHEPLRPNAIAEPGKTLRATRDAVGREQHLCSSQPPPHREQRRLLNALLQPPTDLIEQLVGLPRFDRHVHYAA